LGILTPAILLGSLPFFAMSEAISQDGASDAIAAVAAGIGHLVIGFRVDDNCRAVGIAKHGAIAVIRRGQSRARDQQASNDLAISSRTKIAEIASMEAGWIAVPVFAHCRIPVPAGGRETGRIAASGGVDVDAMHASGKTACIDAKQHARRLAEHADGPQHGAAAGHQAGRSDGDIGRCHWHASGKHQRRKAKQADRLHRELL
jgi:hypothetical protein